MAITLETTHGIDFPPSFDPSPMNSAKEAFRQSYLSFENASLLDELRRTEYARLDEQEQVYLDDTGGGLYAESQLYEHMQVLSRNVFGIREFARAKGAPLRSGCFCNPGVREIAFSFARKALVIFSCVETKEEEAHE